MGSVSGLTAFSLIFLSLSMLIFWSVTDLESNQAIQEQMLKFQAKEIANDIELVGDYEREGYAEVALDSNYTFEIGNDPDAKHSLSLSVGGVRKTVELNKQLEDQNTPPGGSLSEFSTTTLCIYRDYDDWDEWYYNHLPPASPPATGTVDPGDTRLGDIRDPEDPNPSDGSVESDDKHVQIYPGGCLS